MSISGRLRATTDATGQALVLTVIFLVVLLGFAGLAIDVGHAYLVQRQLQASVDAAALAGAQEMPAQSQARLTAVSYGPTAGTNPVVGSSINPNTDITFKCVRAVGCSSRRSPQNAITVSAKSDVPTWFAKLFGKSAFTVHAKATACSPCSAKKFDIVVVLDRTGSMLDRNNGRTDLDNAKAGIRTFLAAMDPELDHVGLGVFPPAVGGPAPVPPNGNLASGSNPCLTPGPRRNGYDAWWPAWDGRGGNGSDSAVYTAASLSDDYIRETSPGNWQLNGSSSLVSRIGCVSAGGTTSYANALIEAKRELMRNGRSDAQDVIVFFTDGAANTMPNDSALETNRLPSMAPGIAEGLLADRSRVVLEPPLQRRPGRRELGHGRRRRSTSSATTSTARTAAAAVSRASPRPRRSPRWRPTRPTSTSLRPATTSQSCSTASRPT